jgi:FkbM family methyltransferase
MSILKLAAKAMRPARRAFYNLGGPWYRSRTFEALGSQRYSRPAMFGMDGRLAELMPWERGVFVEAGAHDGYTQSNTYYLERFRGWSGVLIEPIPELRALCERRRPRSQVVGCALVGPQLEADSVEIQFGDLMSTVGSGKAHAAGGLSMTGRRAYSIEVPARTLSAVLDDARLTKIDLLVLDLEGGELDAIAGLDFARHAPRYLLVEALDRIEQQAALDAALAPHYDFVETLSDYDLLYSRRG